MSINAIGGYRSNSANPTFTGILVPAKTKKLIANELTDFAQKEHLSTQKGLRNFFSNTIPASVAVLTMSFEHLVGQTATMIAGVVCISSETLMAKKTVDASKYLPKIANRLGNAGFSKREIMYGEKKWLRDYGCKINGRIYSVAEHFKLRKMAKKACSENKAV